MGRDDEISLGRLSVPGSTFLVSLHTSLQLSSSSNLFSLPLQPPNRNSWHAEDDAL